MKTTGKIAAAITATVLVLSLTACGKETENTNEISSSLQITSTDSSSSILESSTSSLTESSLDTSSAAEPVEAPQQPEKTPLTEEELQRMELLLREWGSDSPFIRLRQQEREEFDITAEVNDISELDIVLSMMLRDCDADKKRSYRPR